MEATNSKERKVSFLVKRKAGVQRELLKGLKKDAKGVKAFRHRSLREFDPGSG